MDKNKIIEIFSKKVKANIEKQIKKSQFNNSLNEIKKLARVLYDFNQVYTDDFLEEKAYEISKTFSEKYTQYLQHYKPNSNTVLFYDGFGLDVRGVSKMYLNALKKNNYKIIYIVSKQEEEMPETRKILLDSNFSWEVINLNVLNISQIELLITLVLKYQPKAMFYYTTPWDVIGYEMFCVFEGLIDRYLIDLTDHAFWLGRKCNDFFCGSREMSASNQHFGRKIEKYKCIKLGVNLVIDTYQNHDNLPFDVLQKKYIFSGGALYKTLGDSNNYYYKIIDYILYNFSDLYFLYAGNGDTTQMDKLIMKYPNRCFLINERKDYYYLIENCVLYLNTYPMFGGMMMKYAANAKKIPITLKHNDDSDGLLLNQKSALIEYESYDELIKDITLLLKDDNYRKRREDLLERTIISEKRFIDNIQSLLEYHKTDYKHDFIELDTKQFKKEFYDRFDINDIITKENIKYLLSMPIIYFFIIKKIIKKLLKIY